MDNKTRELILETLNERMTNPRIVSFDDTAKMGCNLCGKCCMNRNDILLSVIDLRKIAKKLERSLLDIIQEYCETYIGDNSKVPVVSIRFKWSEEDDNLICQFLNKSGDKYKCSIDECKPNICRLFPVAKISVSSKKESSEEVFYAVGDMECISEEEKKNIKISEWVNKDLQYKNSEWLTAFSDKMSYLHRNYDLDKLYQLESSVFGALMMFLYHSNLSLEDDAALKEYSDLESKNNKDCIAYIDEVYSMLTINKK